MNSQQLSAPHTYSSSQPTLRLPHRPPRQVIPHSSCPPTSPPLSPRPTRTIQPSRTLCQTIPIPVSGHPSSSRTYPGMFFRYGTVTAVLPILSLFFLLLSGYPDAARSVWLICREIGSNHHAAGPRYVSVCRLLRGATLIRDDVRACCGHRIMTDFAQRLPSANHYSNFHVRRRLQFQLP